MDSRHALETRINLKPNLSVITPDLAHRRTRSRDERASTYVPLELNSIKFDHGFITVNGVKLQATDLPERVENVGAAFLLSDGLFANEQEHWQLLLVHRGE